MSTMKLSTSAIKDLIMQWLSTPEAKKALSWHYVHDVDNAYRQSSQQEIDEVAADLGLSSGLSAIQVNDFIVRELTDGSKWKRSTKRKIDFDKSPEDIFYIDLIGFLDEPLIKELTQSSSNDKICWFREFLPKHENLADNFRLEVITTLADDKIIGWTITVD